MSTGAGSGLPPADLPRAGWGREGYRAEEVEAFLDELRRALRQQPPTMAPYEVADQRFAMVRFSRGYAPRAVDEYLDQAQRLLRERHGDDAVAALEGRAPEPRHVPTWWIYLLALVLVAVVVAFTVRQL